VVDTASDVNVVNDAVVMLTKVVGAELVLLTAAVAVLDIGTEVLLLRKTVGTVSDGVTVAVIMTEVVLRAVVFSSGLLVRSKLVDEVRVEGNARTVVLGIEPTEVAKVGTVAILVRLVSSDNVTLGGAKRLVELASAEDVMVGRAVRFVASVVEDRVPGAIVKLVLIVPDVKVVVIVRVRMTGDSDAVSLTATVELESPDCVTCSLLDAVVSSGLGSGLADIAVVVFAKFGGGAADGTCPWLLDEGGDVEFNHTEDSVRGEAVGRSIVVVNGEGVVGIGVVEREIWVLVRLFGG
jgi:hypothetical protein